MTTMADEDQIQEQELLKAGERIQAQRGQHGDGLRASLAWVLTFLQEDANSYSYEEFRCRWWEVLRFCRDGGLAHDDSRLSNLAQIRYHVHGLGAICPGPGQRDQLLTLQSGWKTGVQIYLSGGNISTSDVQVRLTAQKGTPGVSVTAIDEATAFEFQLIHLLGFLGQRINECRYCKKLFLAGRTDKRFCAGTSCQAMQYKIDHPKNKALKRHAPKNMAARKRKKGGRYDK